MDASVGMVMPGSPAEKGGIEAGDRILSVDGVDLVNWFDFLQAIRSRPEPVWSSGFSGTTGN
jgi:regulator of sigma E protease